MGKQQRLLSCLSKRNHVSSKPRFCWNTEIARSASNAFNAIYKGLNSLNMKTEHRWRHGMPKICFALFAVSIISSFETLNIYSTSVVCQKLLGPVQTHRPLAFASQQAPPWFRSYWLNHVRLRANTPMPFLSHDCLSKSIAGAAGTNVRPAQADCYYFLLLFRFNQHTQIIYYIWPLAWKILPHSW